MALSGKDLNLLSNRDLTDILEIVESANCHHNVSRMRANVVTAVKRSFSARGVAFFVCERGSATIDNASMVSVGMDLSYMDKWLDRYSRQDPFQHEGRSSTPVCKVDDILPYSRWEKLRLYCEFYRPQNIYYKLSMYLRSNSTPLGLIGICRSREDEDFSAREVAKARILVPHLATALEKAALLSRLLTDRDEALRESYQLTRREIDIVHCVCKGMTNGQIAAKLYISRYTVETHLKNIFEKTGVKHRAALAGLLQSP